MCVSNLFCVKFFYGFEIFQKEKLGENYGQLRSQDRRKTLKSQEHKENLNRGKLTLWLPSEAVHRNIGHRASQSLRDKDESKSPCSRELETRLPYQTVTLEVQHPPQKGEVGTKAVLRDREMTTSWYPGLDSGGKKSTT